MPKDEHYGKGDIELWNTTTNDITSNLNLSMNRQGSVSMHRVAGKFYFAISQESVSYDISILKYQTHIDEVPWTLIAACADTLENELDDYFWQKVNHGRKDKLLSDVAWSTHGDKYDVSREYDTVELPLFDQRGCTRKVVRPFSKDMWIRVHANGLLTFAEEKKLDFILQFIVVYHQMIPQWPQFWTQEEGNRTTIQLCRTSLWTHEETVKYLAETNSTFPEALEAELKPRILRARQLLGRETAPAQPQRTNANPLAPSGENSAAVEARPPQPPKPPDPPRRTAEADDKARRYFRMLSQINAQASRFEPPSLQIRPGLPEATNAAPQEAAAISQQKNRKHPGRTHRDPTADRYYHDIQCMPACQDCGLSDCHTAHSGCS